MHKIPPLKEKIIPFLWNYIHTSVYTMKRNYLKNDT